MSGFSDAGLPLIWTDERTIEKSVLIVDDDPFWQEVIRLEVERALGSCSVTMVTNVDQASRLLHQNTYDLVVADHFLEGEKTGYDLWQLCQAEGVGVPFLLTSGQLLPINAAKQSVEFTPKPIGSADMSQKVIGLLHPTRSIHLEGQVLIVLAGLVIWAVLVFANTKLEF
ncbi:MAG: response regulator [Bdellovibrionales bacterium]